MITDEEVLLYLEHHGVKGMHWGVRTGSKVKPRDVGLSKKQVKKQVINPKKEHAISEEWRIQSGKSGKPHGGTVGQTRQKSKLTAADKVAIGVAVIAGAALVHKLLTNKGGIKKTVWHNKNYDAIRIQTSNLLRNMGDTKMKKLGTGVNLGKTLAKQVRGPAISPVVSLLRGR